MMNYLYAILLILHFVNGNYYVTEAFDDAVNRQELDHCVVMHQFYSDVVQKLNSETFSNSNTRPVCPTGAHGLLPDPTDCAKFINCNGMESIVRNCGPGTVFNPDMEICDWPQNVNCEGRTGYFEQHREPEIPKMVDASTISTSGNQNARFTDSRAGTKERGDFYTPECPDGAYGLLPHPYNCAKFMNCHGGRTFIQDCGPGTHFNPKTQVCDLPQNVNCESPN